MSKYLRVMGLCFSSAIVIALIGFVTTVAWTTPSQAQDDVCDGLEGAVHGLCQAYCQAMDCDALGYLQHPLACDAALDNYKNLTSIPGPPCDCGTTRCCDEFLLCFNNCTEAGTPCEDCNTTCFPIVTDCSLRCCAQDIGNPCLLQCINDNCQPLVTSECFNECRSTCDVGNVFCSISGCISCQ